MTALRGPGDFGKTCGYPGCTRQAMGGASGMCRQHAGRSYTVGTSDGRSTGSYPKLTVEQVAEARRMRAAFKSKIEIARHLGVHVTTIRSYLRGDIEPLPAAAINARETHCVHGHEFTPENTGIDRYGRRRCRTCRRDEDRRRRSKGGCIVTTAEIPRGVYPPAPGLLCAAIAGGGGGGAEHVQIAGGRVPVGNARPSPGPLPGGGEGLSARHLALTGFFSGEVGRSARRPASPGPFSRGRLACPPLGAPGPIGPFSRGSSAACRPTTVGGGL